MKNIAESARTRLLNLSRSQGVPFDDILLRYVTGSILHRLNQSKYREPPETVIAEKLETAVSKGLQNSRMKDFFDLHWLQGHQSLKLKFLRFAL